MRRRILTAVGLAVLSVGCGRSCKGSDASPADAAVEAEGPAGSAWAFVVEGSRAVLLAVGAGGSCEKAEAAVRARGTGELAVFTLAPVLFEPGALFVGKPAAPERWHVVGRGAGVLTTRPRVDVALLFFTKGGRIRFVDEKAAPGAFALGDGTNSALADLGLPAIVDVTSCGVLSVDAGAAPMAIKVQVGSEPVAIASATVRRTGGEQVLTLSTSPLDCRGADPLAVDVRVEIRSGVGDGGGDGAVVALSGARIPGVAERSVPNAKVERGTDGTYVVDVSADLPVTVRGSVTPTLCD